MAAYVLDLTPLLDHPQSVKRSIKHAASADYLTSAGILEEMKIWWNTLSMVTTQSQQFHALL